MAFNANDRIIAITDNASASTFAGNWFKADYTDQVLSVDGTTGTVTVGAIIAAATAKTTPVDGDAIALADSASSNATKKVTFASLASWVWSKLGGLINGGTAKTAPADADLLVLADSAASNVAKKLTWANAKVALKGYFDTLYQPKSGGWTQIGTTQTASGKNTITFGSIPAHDEHYFEVSDIAISTNGSADGYLLGFEFSTDNGVTYYGANDAEGSPVENVYYILKIYSGTSNDVPPGEVSFVRESPSVTVMQSVFISGSGYFPSHPEDGGHSGGGALLTTAPLTNLRIKAYWYEETGNTFTATNMTAGTIKLFGR